jgi:hypothetical protein
MNDNHGKNRGNAGPRPGARRGLRAVLGAVATVVLGPPAATASVLGQANAAPPHHGAKADLPHHAVKADRRHADRTHAYIPSGTSRRTVA